MSESKVKISLALFIYKCMFFFCYVDSTTKTGARTSFSTANHLTQLICFSCGLATFILASPHWQFFFLMDMKVLDPLLGIEVWTDFNQRKV